MNRAQNELNKRLYSHYSFNHSYASSNYFKTPLDTLNNKTQMVDTSKSMNGTFDATVEDRIRHQKNTLDLSSELYSLNSGLVRQQNDEYNYFSKIKQNNDNKLIYVDEHKVFNNSSRF